MRHGQSCEGKGASGTSSKTKSWHQPKHTLKELTTIVLAFVLPNAYLSSGAYPNSDTPILQIQCPLGILLASPDAIDSRQKHFISDCITRIIIILRILRHPEASWLTCLYSKASNHSSTFKSRTSLPNTRSSKNTPSTRYSCRHQA